MSYQNYSSPVDNTNKNGYSWYECDCCPYGYHIDLDFVRYCESIIKEDDNRTGSIKRRKDRRRQRQSMEVLLGLTPPVLAVLEQSYKPIHEQNTPSPVVTKTPTSKFPFQGDGFDDAVFDFERALQRSKNKLSNNLPDVTAVSASGKTVTAMPTAHDGLTLATKQHDFDAVSIESCGMSPLALQNIREQMALSLERTKQLEDQVKLLPELKDQVSTLKEENRRLLLRLKSEETVKLNSLNGNYIQPNYNRQRSQSFTNVDKIENSTKKESPPPPPPRKDFGVMCGVLTRNIGVGHQNPNTKSVSTTTIENDIGDKWLPEKVKFMNIQNSLNTFKKISVSRETQTILSRDKRDVGIQFKFEAPQPPKSVSSTQTSEIQKQISHRGVLAKARVSDFAIQKCVECYSIGCSDDTINDIVCEKCNAFKRSVAVGPDTSEDIHTSPVSLASLTSRSKSFNLGEDRLNLSVRTRTVGSQHEPDTKSRSCQSDLRAKSSSKSCQCERSTAEKNTQYEPRGSTSKHTDTQDLRVPTRHVGCEAREVKSGTCEVACNTSEEALCGKCEKEKESLKKDGGSPTPSRIPRPQIPTTPVENRKFRRQDTYTKIYSPPAETTSLTSRKNFSRRKVNCRLSGLDLSSKTISNETTSPLEKVKNNFKLGEAPISQAQNGMIGSAPITKVQVQEVTLPVSTIFPSIASQNRKKAIPSKEMQGAMKVLNDSLLKNPTKTSKNHSAINIVQQEWFKISSMVTADPLDVEDYLDALEDMSSLLLEHVVNMCDSSGNTAMHYAVSHGNFDVVSILLDSKVCDINKQNKVGYTSVMLVSLAEVRSQTHANVVRRLFQLADVNIRAKQHGQTALMLAVSHGRLDMVKLLLEAGADINIQDEDGSTALMCSAEHGHIEIVKHLLCQPDCDSTITDVDGSTALKIAMEAGHRHIGVLLYAHERTLQKTHNVKVKKTKSMSPKATPSSPLPIRSSHRALTDTKPK
ncbi:unnamed protein product [Phaedon cochleariae]|uniref:KN motif and ankyrin repeat domain-containing protein 2 n=1 Tax=Phaedon cochleariae TaxID=80249 RepID=A0A9N9X3W3_PHACE|nr:unnamed protein product [Phaedon cochleariae]